MDGLIVACDFEANSVARFVNVECQEGTALLLQLSDAMDFCGYLGVLRKFKGEARGNLLNGNNLLLQRIENVSPAFCKLGF